MDANSETTPVLVGKRSRDGIWDELETFELSSRSRPRTTSLLEAGADAAELAGQTLPPICLPNSPSKNLLMQGPISPRAIARVNLSAGSYCLASSYFNPVLHAKQPHVGAAAVALPALPDAANSERVSPTSVLQGDITPVKSSTTSTANETPEKTIAEPTKAEGVRLRLAEAQANAKRKGVDGSLKWRYDSGDELTGATCAGVEFTREELLLLCC